MKNIRSDMTKTVIFLENDEFERILRHILPTVKVTYDLEGVDFTDENDNYGNTLDKVEKTLARYFDVGEITSIHIDDCEYNIGVWICYRGDHYTSEEDEIEYVTEDNVAEFIGQIVDIFEDFCELKNYTIPSEDRDLEIEEMRKFAPSDYDDMTDEEIANMQGMARIYGDAYDEIGDVIRAKFNEMVKDETTSKFIIKSDDMALEFVKDIMDAFCELLDRANIDYDKEDVVTHWGTFRSDYNALDYKIKQTLINWNVHSHTFYTTHHVHGRFVSKVTTFTDNIDEIKDQGDMNYEEADFGALKDIDGDVTKIENEEGNIIWN